VSAVRGVVQCEHEGRFSEAVVRTFWCKTLDFSKFTVCPHGQGELSSADILLSRREGG